MFMSPADVILSWIRGLLSLCLIAAGVWLLIDWYHSLPEVETRVLVVEKDRPVKDRSSDAAGEERVVERKPLSPVERVTHWRPRVDQQSAKLYGAVFLLLWSFAGRFLRISRLFAKQGEPNPELQADSIQRLVRPDGTEIHMEISGPANAPTVVLTHGWSLSREEWAYLQKDWGSQFRLVVWDLPGLGRSSLSPHRVFTLEEMARDLHAVIEASGSDPVILMGHSIGGMTILTFCRLFPNLLGSRVSKLVLVHTTYKNPLHTMFLSGLFTALQKPLVEPLLYLQIWLSPVFWLLNCLSYQNGSVHSSVARNGFAGNGSTSQQDLIARYYLVDSPAVLARGTLAMLEYDATATLPTIKIPVLVVGAEEDPVTTVQASQKIAADVSHGTLVTLRPAKHFGLLEYHTDFARQTAQFCASVPR